MRKKGLINKIYRAMDKRPEKAASHIPCNYIVVMILNVAEPEFKVKSAHYSTSTAIRLHKARYSFR